MSLKKDGFSLRSLGNVWMFLRLSYSKCLDDDRSVSRKHKSWYEKQQFSREL